jgi:hypothetical protein
MATSEGANKRYDGATDGTGLIKWDPWLEPFADTLRARYAHVKRLLAQMDEKEGGLLHFAEGFATLPPLPLHTHAHALLSALLPDLACLMRSETFLNFSKKSEKPFSPHDSEKEGAN